jgi:hypothetical protein
MSPQVIQVSIERIGKDALGRSQICRLSNRSMDLEASSPSNRPKAWSGISTLPRLETPGDPGTELSETPTPKVIQRDEENIANWKRYRGPHINKAERLRGHLVFLDESGFVLIPNVCRTRTPRGHTPLLYHLL